MYGLTVWPGRRAFDLLDAIPSLLEDEGYPGLPAINVWSGENEVEVTAELPGMDPEKIDVAVEDDLLTIKGTREKSETKKDGTWIRRERLHGAFQRSFRLPWRVAANEVKADYTNGILKLTLPRAEEDKPKRISVKIS